MKINFKLKGLAAAAIMAATAPAVAAIDGADSGNGELLLNLRYYGGDSPTTGGDDISGLFDLGFKMDDMMAANGQGRLQQKLGSDHRRLRRILEPADQLCYQPGGNMGQIQFNVIALDTTDLNAKGGSRYLTTGHVDSWPSQTNTNVKGFVNMQGYLDANNSRGTHATDANGASVATPTDPSNTFFGAINGAGQGDTWLAKTTVDTTQVLGTEQNFWFLTTSSTSSLGPSHQDPIRCRPEPRRHYRSRRVHQSFVKRGRRSHHHQPIR